MSDAERAGWLARQLEAAPPLSLTQRQILRRALRRTANTTIDLDGGPSNAATQCRRTSA